MEYYLTHDKFKTAEKIEVCHIRVCAGNREKNKYFLISYYYILDSGKERSRNFQVHGMDLDWFEACSKEVDSKGNLYCKLVTWNEAKNASPGFAQQLEDLGEFFTNK